jgi:transcriptional regulator with XRE-family HTH domain
MEATWFAPRLKELREAAGLTQPELADRAGMNRFGIAKLEQGVTKPSWDTVVALCKALGVSCDSFLQESTSVLVPKRGRPPKAHAEPPAGPKPKRPRRSRRKEK